MAEAREHPAVEKFEEALGAALLLVRGQIPGIRAGRFSLNLVSNGESFPVEVEHLAPERVQLTIATRRYVIEFESRVPEAKTPELSLSRAKPVASGDGILRAPIPGIVAALLFNLGDQVMSTDHVIRIEAMKMQNALPSGKSGTITKIFVTPGQEVSEGDPLLQIA